LKILWLFSSEILDKTADIIFRHNFIRIFRGKLEFNFDQAAAEFQKLEDL